MVERGVNFIRHSEHKGEFVIPELTANGVKEARSMGHILGISDHDDYVAFTINRPRFIGTVVLAMMPHINIDEVGDISRRLIYEKRIILDDSLDYKPMSDELFKNDMMTAFNSGRAIGFLVSESDKYLSTDDHSTYNTMSSLMAKKLLATTGNSIYCTKELMTASLRARITSLRHGPKQLSDYVDWYMNNEECSSEARTHVVKIQTDGNEYILRDSYGEIEFDKQILNNIIGAQGCD